MTAKFKSNKGFENTRGSSNEKAPRVEELVDVLKFPANEWVQLRFIGPLVSYGNHWVQVKKNDGSLTKFPTPCLSYDPDTEEHDSTKECPWCDNESDKIQTGKEYYINAIVRQLQEDKPDRERPHTASEKKTGLKEKGSKSWTAVRVVRLTGSVVREIKKIASLNRHKDKKTGEKKSFPLTHAKYGMDVSIMYDPNEKTPSKKYTIQKADASPLTEEEDGYLLYQIEDLIKTPSLKTARAEYDRWAERNLSKSKKSKGREDEDEDDESDDDEDDEDLDEPKKGKSKAKKPAASKKKKPHDDDDEDDDDDDDEDEDDLDEDEEDDDPPPKKKKGAKPAAKGKKKPRDDDEDDEDDDDLDEDEEDEDDDEDDEPAPKKKGKPAAKKSAKGKKKAEDDDEEDEDDEDDLDDDDDDLDDEEEDDDEDDDPPAKKGKSGSKKAASKKPAAKGKKPRDEDDDDDEEDEEDEEEDDLDDDDDLDDEEDDDEDEPPKKKSKPSAKKAVKGKKR